MKILITGANGQLGWELKRTLAKKHDLILTDIVDNSKIKNQNLYHLDITDANQAQKLISQTKPDWIIHAAAYTNVDGAEDNSKIAFEINRNGSRNIAQATQKIGAKLIAISTDYVFDGKSTPSVGYSEDDATHPLAVYGKSKLAGEIAIRAACPQAIILRTAWLYGGWPITASKFKNPDYPDAKRGIFKNFPNTILYNLAQGKELKVVDDQRGCPTYAGDLARAIEQVVEKKIASGVYHATNRGQGSWYDFALAVAKEVKVENYESKIKPCPTKDFPTKARRPKNTILSIQKLQKAGITMPRWQQGVRSFLAES